MLGLCVRAVGLAVVSAAFTLLLGLWASLQLSWLTAQEPGVARLGERLLFALLPVPYAVLPTWGATAIYGAACSPWVLSAGLGASYCLLCGTAPTSYPAPPPQATAAAAAGRCYGGGEGEREVAEAAADGAR